MKEENIIEELKRKVEEGGQVTREEALALSRVEDKKALYEAAGAIRDRFAGRYFDTCSIVNARSFRELQVVCAVGRVQNARAGVRIN